MNVAVAEVATAIAAYGLVGSAHALPVEPLDDPRWRSLLSRVRLQRLQGHLLQAVGDGALPATREQVCEAGQLHGAAMASALLLERTLLEAADALAASDVPYRVLKGSALAHLDYRNPAERVFGDIDLLVPTGAFEPAVRVLGELGYQRRLPQLRPGFDRRFGKGVTLVGHDNRQVDLHRTFVMGPFGLTVDTDALFDGATSFRLAGRRLPALADDERFLHACYNAALGDAPPRLVPLRDVAELLLGGKVDEGRVRDVARRWRGEAVVARAVRLAWETLALADTVPLSVWAARYEPSRQERRALASYRPATHYSQKALASLPVIRGLGAKGAYLRAVLFPDRSYLQQRHQTYHRWLRRGSKVVLGQRSVR